MVTTGIPDAIPMGRNPMTHHWLAPVRTEMAALPPTLPGLASALLMVEHASSLIARAHAGEHTTQTVDSTPRSGSTRTAEIALLCASAAGCLPTAEIRTNALGAPTRDLPSLGAPLEPQDPAHLRALDALLRDCIDLAVEVLDNEEEDLPVATIHEIAAAVGLIDRARAACTRGAA
jgi:hypothetical protein